MKLTNTREMRDMDRRAIEEYGISEELLMENAGLDAYHVIRNRYTIGTSKFLILCGVGNNGGDGLVVARKLHSVGAEIKVLIVGDPAKYSGAALKNFGILSKLPVDTRRVDSIDAVKDAMSRCNVLVDALFGTGLTREVSGVYRDVILAMNASGKDVMSIDIPSGINGDTGEIMGVAVRAHCTVTFGTPKLGNLLYPGFAHCGLLFVSHISFPHSLSHSGSVQVEVNTPPELPERAKDGHKGTFGDVLFIAGASNYYGAPLFSALSFLKAGGGYARLASPRSLTPFIAVRGSEIVFAPQEETAQGSIALSSRDSLLRLSEQVDMVVIGPGLSLNEETQELVRELAVAVKKPILIDGDGISAIASRPSMLGKREHPTILTPHPGEMSRITGIPVPEVKEKRIELLQEHCRTLSCFIVLKTAHSLIGYPDGRVYINMSGNPGMATAGSGDTLNGAIAAMFGLGLDTGDALRTAVFLHGLSGDLAAGEKGEDGITARDILDFLPQAVKRFRHDRVSILNNFYGNIFLL
jgi:hydroxyethylthiazole kinase-like uncharacterized protein yjeF